MKLSFQHLFYIIAVVFGLLAAMVLARPLLIPLSLALFISFILLPVVKKLETWGAHKALSVFLSIFLLFLLLGGSILLFSAEIVRLSDELNDFSGKVLSTLTDVIVFFNQNLNFIEDIEREEMIQGAKDWLKESSGYLIQNAFSSTTEFITGLVSTVIFTFLILIYRRGLTDAFVAFGDEENRDRIFRMLKNVQGVGQKYLSGMILLIILLGLANSFGLWIIGIDSPFLFGFLAAILSIIPFIGTTIGATIPVLYAFMSSDSLWTPLAVVFLFWGIQTIESNFLNPKIVGKSVNVNALVAILSLLIGAAVWGVAGMVLFLPFAAMLRVVCQEFDQLKPLAMLIGDDLSDKSMKESKVKKWILKTVNRFRK